MSADTPRDRAAPAAPRPGGRSERVRRAVLDAAADELLEVGFERLSVASVARRAGVHHTTVYRRWETKSRLVLDALLDFTRERVPAPDLGDLRSDLQAYFEAMVSAFARPRVAALVRGLVAIPPDEFAQERSAYWQERFAVAGEIVQRAIARGELPAQGDSWRLVELIAGPLWMRALMTGLPVDGDFLTRAIDDALRALAPDGPR
jgi:AcrR family transcriptional regulator